MEPAAAMNPVSLMMSYGPLLLIVGVFYFLVLRPQLAQAKAQAAMLAALKVGDVVLVGAVFGKIKSLHGDTVVVTVADEVNLTILKTAVTRVLAGDEAKALKLK